MRHATSRQFKEPSIGLRPSSGCGTAHASSKQNRSSRRSYSSSHWRCASHGQPAVQQFQSIASSCVTFLHRANTVPRTLLRAARKRVRPQRPRQHCAARRYAILAPNHVILGRPSVPPSSGSITSSSCSSWPRASFQRAPWAAPPQRFRTLSSLHSVSAAPPQPPPRHHRCPLRPRLRSGSC